MPKSVNAAVPSIGDRLERIDRMLVRLQLSGLSDPAQWDEHSIDPVDVMPALLEDVTEARCELWWLQRLSPDILQQPAPTDDEKARAERGGAR